MNNEHIKNQSKRIVIIGDSGRGKTTFAKKLSEKLNIPLYHLDDFFWKKKYSEKNTHEEILEKVTHVYVGESWIIEGTTRKFLMLGFDRADTIFNLSFKSIFAQWYSIIKRYFKRDEETFSELLELIKHVFYKRYSLGYMKGSSTEKELLQPHHHKAVTFHSFGEINDYLQSLDTNEL